MKGIIILHSGPNTSTSARHLLQEDKRDPSGRPSENDFEFHFQTCLDTRLLHYYTNATPKWTTATTNMYQKKEHHGDNKEKGKPHT
jgi:hypothetical protein